MVYINTTGKHNEVWLDKPYATITVECPDCPSTEDAYNSGWTDGSEDGYHKGYQSGYTDGLEACSGGSCEGIWEDGYDSGYTDAWQPAYDSGYTDGLEACSGETIHNQYKYCNIGTGRTDDLKLIFTGNCYTFEDSPQVNITYDSGYTGLERVGVFMYFYPTEALQEGFNSGYTSGYTDGLNACSGGSCEGIWEAGYDSGFTDGVNSVECSGYTQEDLDAAFASGYSAGLRDCSGYTPDTGNTNVLDFIYETSSSNEKINLFIGDAQYTNSFFKAFYSAITFMEIDGVVVYPNPEDIEIYQGGEEDRINLYTHSFAQSGSHTVKFYMDKSFSASTITGTKYPAYELTELIFASNSNIKCPITEATIGDGYEYVHMGVFQGSDILTSVTIPSSVTAITNFVFENSALKTLTCNRTTHPSLGVDVFNGANALEHIYVPASAVEDYKAATNWSNYASIISAIQ